MKNLSKNLFRVNVFLKDHFDHSYYPFEKKLLKEINLPWIDQLLLSKSYIIYGNYQIAEIQQVTEQILSDPILENYEINTHPLFPKNFSKHSYQVEVGFKPGVVDNEARTILSGLEDLLENFDSQTEIFTSKIYTFNLNESKNKSEFLSAVEKKLYNNLIERQNTLDFNEFSNLRTQYPDQGWQENWQFLFIPQPEIEKLYEEIPLKEMLSDENQALHYAKEKLWFFNLDEMKAIADYYSREEILSDRAENQLPINPTDLEIEVLAQTWSEHCKHKIFAADIEYTDEKGQTEKISSLYATYIKSVTKKLAQTRNDLISVFSDNSGIFSFTDELAVCMKVETHNSPSALDPFGGAITGILGVNRDIMGTGIGALPLFNTDVFCFADPFYEKEIPGSLLHPKRIFKGVHHGVERGGNESGIPTVNGSIVFDNRFLGKPLVFCGTGGIIPKTITAGGKTISTEDKPISSGDLIAVVGGRVGKDGIHGATFSSEGLEESSPTSAVQIGDSIMQKKVMDFLIQARDQLLYRTLTDNGAGGLSSSIGEMATLVRSDKNKGGCVIELDKNKTKYPGLKPWEILVSESQERMTLAVQPENQKALTELAKLFDVEISFIGKFNDSGFLTATYEDKKVGRISLDFLHDGVPTLQLKARWQPQKNLEPKISELTNESISELIVRILKRPNIASKEFWVRQYDHEVKAMTVLKPFDGAEEDAPMDAAVIKPLYDSSRGLVISNGLVPRYSDIDAYHMSSNAIDEAVRNLVAVGGNPSQMVALDNFCWPDPIMTEENYDGDYKLAQLVRANQALKDACLIYNLPLISGKDSMKNDYGKGAEKISIPPTLLVTAITTIDDVKKLVSSHFKEIGSKIYLIGVTKNELGGSEFFAEFNTVGNQVPQVDFGFNKKIYQALYQAIQNEWISACHDLSDGGLAVALAESCFGGMIGVDIDLDNIAIAESDLTNLANLADTDEREKAIIKLFSESAGRFIVEVSEENEAAFKALFTESPNQQPQPITEIGTTEAHEALIIRSNHEELVSSDIEELKLIWKHSLNF